jgi:maleylacetate reductase
MIYQGFYDATHDRTKIVFGENSLETLHGQVSICGKRVVLITSKTIHYKTNLAKKVIHLLGSSLVGVFAETQAHTPRNSVLKATALARSVKADVLVNLGGGSTTDTAKAVRLALWMNISGEGDFDKALVRLQGEDPEGISECSVPQVCLPTTLVGAEYSSGMGITDEATQTKQVFSHNFLRCRTVILDPQLTLHTPPVLFLSTGIKSLEHAIGRLSSPERHPVLDATAALAVRILGSELPRAFRNPDHLAPRSQLQIGGWLSKFGSGVIPGMHMGLSHALGRQIGSVCGVSHGLSSCIILPLSIEYNASACEGGFTLAAQALGVNTSGLSGKDVGLATANKIRSLIQGLGLPNRLREVGVSKDSLPLIAERTMTDWSIKANPRKIEGAEEIVAILETAW